MSESFEIPEAEWAVVGALGEPGRRTFYLQAGRGAESVTLKLEKQHVQALTQFLAEILADLPAPDPHPSNAPTTELREPVEAAWAAGSIRLSYEGDTDRILLFAEEIGAEGIVAEDVGTEDPDTAVTDLGTAAIGISRRQAVAIVAGGEQLLSAGRPDCPLCGRPMDPEGHSCPRTNGHRQH